MYSKYCEGEKIVNITDFIVYQENPRKSTLNLLKIYKSSFSKAAEYEMNF